MTTPIQPLKLSQPGYQPITGRFIIPAPFAPGGFLNTTDSETRPLKIGTDVNIACTSTGIEITLVADLSNWGINVNDAVILNASNLNGEYKIASITSLGVGGKITCPASADGLTVSAGYIVFSNFAGPFWQKITGDGTKFLQTITANKWIGVLSPSLDPTVQVCKVAKVVSDTELWVYGGFFGNLTDQVYNVVGGSIRGVAINCEGAGVVNGKAVASGDILNFFFEKGLEPVCGDAGSNTFKILTER